MITKRLNNEVVDTAVNRDRHLSVPILEGIRRYHELGIVPFSTPGHKLGVGADEDLVSTYGEAAFRSDIPLGGGVGDTHFSGHALEHAESLAADAWGAERSYFLLNGSSAGNHAVLLAAIRPGDTVIVSRDLHKSLMVALILSGANPVYVSPELHPTKHVGLGITAAQVKATLDLHPDTRLIALVSPSYCGVPSDLAGIARVAHQRGIPVHVDEAWGPQFHFHPDLPPSAMASGVDTAVMSTHKVLGSFTQAAVLHQQGSRIDPDRLHSTVGMVQTTSPSVMILASIDATRRQMALHGESLLDRTISLARQARKRLQAIPGVSVLDGPSLGIASIDLTKVVVDVDGLGITGYEAEGRLRHHYGVGPEMSDLVSLMFLVTIGDTQASIDQLVAGFTGLSNGSPAASAYTSTMRSSGAPVTPATLAMTPHAAFFAAAHAVPLADCVGAVSAELVIPYPPGIPVLAPGEVITAEKVAYLREGASQGMYLSGPADSSLTTIRIVTG